RMRAFFYKHVALYEGKIRTWKDLAQEWENGVKKAPGLNKLVDTLSFSWLRQHIIVLPIGKLHGLTFQAYVYEKTIRALEKLLKVDLNSTLRKHLLEEMLDENFRMQLVFHMGHPDYLERVYIDESSTQPITIWLRAIQHFIDHRPDSFSLELANDNINRGSIRVLENLLGVKLDSTLRKQLLKEMLDENFRTQLVFYMSHPDELKKTSFDERSTQSITIWLRAIQHFIAHPSDSFSLDFVNDNNSGGSILSDGRLQMGHLSESEED
ncbi:MAG: hypothetical protein K940chlam6_01217, partial [Chlamydiae bacterium]|nr:hypothetical protein [Chlamydiota bacterium]